MSCRTEGIQEIGDSRADPNDRPPKPVEMVGVLVFAQAIKKGIGITAKVLVCAAIKLSNLIQSS